MFIHEFLTVSRKLIQTDGQTNTPMRKHNLFGRG